MYNNAYVEDRWGAFRHAGAMRLITRKASAAVVEVPSSPLDPKCKSFPAYHIKGGVLFLGVRYMVSHVPATCVAHPLYVIGEAGLTLGV